MAGEAVVGALRVVLGLDSASFDKGLKGAESQLKNFSSSVLKVAAGVAAAVGVSMSVSALTQTIKETIDEISRLGSVSKQIGIPIEELSKLQFAAKLSGLDIDQLSKSLGLLSKAMFGVATGAKQDLANALNVLGVSLKGVGVEEALLRIADKFAGLKDGAAKTALAMQLFGREGKELIPFLNKGRDGIEELKQKASELGLVLSEETVAQAKEFNRNLKIVEATTQGVKIQLARELLPELAKLSKIYADLSKDAVLLRAASDGIVFVFRSLLTISIGLVVVFGRLSVSLAAIAEVFAAIQTGELDKIGISLSNAKEVGEESVRVFGNLGDTIRKVWSEATQVTIRKSAGDLKEFDMAALAASKALDSFFQSTRKGLAAQEADAAAIGKSIGEREKLRVILQAESIAAENHIVITDALRAKITALGDAAAATASKLTIGQMVQDALPAWQQYELQLARIKEALDKNGVSVENQALVLKKLAESSGQAWNQVSADITGSFANTFKEFAKNNKSMGIAAKAFGIANALINTYTAVTKALAIYGPTPIGFAAAAAAVAAGVAQVANISAQKFAVGGQFIVPGGHGGKDNFPLMGFAQPGERVTVDPINDSPAGSNRGRQGNATTITVIGEIFNREQVRSLIEKLNAAIGDGARLNVKYA